MSLPASAFRPVAIGLLLAVGGCGQSTQQQAAQPSMTKQAPLADLAAKSEARRAATPMLESYALPVAPEPLPAGYRDQDREQYQKLAQNPVHSVAEAPVSTFSIDVDTGSYANVRRLLNEGRLPPQGAVRLEEMLNYFPYAYAPPSDDSPFGITTELAPSPWNPHTRLLRIGIKASERSVEQLPPANLVFLVDVSGSMDRREGLPLVKGTLKLLVDQLRPQDKVSLVVYAGDSRVVLEPTSGKDKAKIRAAIEQLQAGGSTAGAAGIELAYRMAQQGFIDKGINRILLATDGDFNVGISDFDSLKAMAAEKRRSGVSLATLGFGVDNYNERLMEQLADAGDGNYAYIDNLREARKVLVEQLSSTLAVLAKNVKLQLEFNPAQVSEYRLLGYENRALKREDFNNDQVDAGEIGAGHTVTALYEIVPKGQKGWLEPLRYQAEAKPAGKGDELAWLRVRWQKPEGGPSQLVERPIATTGATDLARASDDLRFAAAVAAFAQQLDGARYTGGFDLGDTLALARSARGEDPFGLRGEFLQLVELARSLQTPLARNP
ncbi:VWA domain-containing protein [Pseudomonas citronellolis]|uniref:vWA domain-containing protein n=1 Tax=Pseudomonas citronellolis TaxID=53408 RepID=UPI002647BE73|nr:VWA domain-containing protein [Pseudomonas citronellolis]MDN6873195.1 VWA domain-containing protein [Pseudomonas citronellolis]